MDVHDDWNEVLLQLKKLNISCSRCLHRTTIINNEFQKIEKQCIAAGFSI